MSRIGKLPVALPKGVEVKVESDAIAVKGPKGSLNRNLVPEVSIDVADSQVLVHRVDDSQRAKAMHGLYRSLVKNMITGVSDGFSKALQINGVGYRAELKGANSLLLNVGFSTQIDFRIPEGVTITLDGQTKVIVSGIDNELVGKVASEIRSIRPPEPYKGKGIRYENEYVRRKVGKSGVK